MGGQAQPLGPLGGGENASELATCSQGAEGVYQPTSIHQVENCSWGLTPWHFQSALLRDGVMLQPQEVAIRERVAGSYIQMSSAQGRWAGHREPQPKASLMLPLGNTSPPVSILVVWLALSPPSQSQVVSVDGSEIGICPNRPIRAHPGTSAGSGGEKLCQDCPASRVWATWRRVMPIWRRTQPRKGDI